MRRRLAGYRAALLTLLAGLMSVPVALLPWLVARSALVNGSSITIPWVGIGVVCLAVPLVAGLGGLLLSREPPTAFLLRPLE